MTIEINLKATSSEKLFRLNFSSLSFCVHDFHFFLENGNFYLAEIDWNFFWADQLSFFTNNLNWDCVGVAKLMILALLSSSYLQLFLRFFLFLNGTLIFSISFLFSMQRRNFASFAEILKEISFQWEKVSFLFEQIFCEANKIHNRIIWYECN